MIFLIRLACAIICCVVAERKDRNGVGRFFLGFFTGPLALVIILVLEPKKDETDG